MELRLLMAVGAVAAATAGSAFADAVTIDPIGWRQNGGANVPAGTEQTVTAPITVGPGGTFVKTGAGTLEVPETELRKYPSADHLVLDGTVRLTTGTSAALAVPDCFAKASQWFSAMDEKYIVSSNGDNTVWRWFDVREENVTGSKDFVPTRPFMQHACDTNVAIYADRPQWFLRHKGRNAVYGGGDNTKVDGKNNGGHMELLYANGTKCDERYVYAVFFVHTVSNYWGNMIGSRKDPNAFFVGGGPKSVPEAGFSGYYYYRADTMTPTVTARNYRNGEVFDPFHSYVYPTTELIGADFADRPTAFSLFFGHRQGDNNKRYGGDFLSEAVVFTNQLSEAEVAEVNRYLMDKWGLSNDVKHSFGLSTNGVVEISKACDSTTEAVVATNHLPILFNGEGTVVKKDSNVLSLRSMTFENFNGVFKLAEGSVLSRFDEIFPLMPETGKKYEAAMINYNAKTDLVEEVSLDVRQGTKTTVSTGPAGTITKTGNGELAVVGIPEEAKKVEVNAGTLTLIPRKAKKVYASGGAISATFEDPGVENVQIPDSEVSSNHCRKQIDKNSSIGGWYRPNTDGNVGIVAGPINISGSYFNYRIAEGRQAVYMFNTPTVGRTSELYTKVAFPAAGTYRVSWRETRANGNAETMSYAYYVMLGETWAEAEKVDHRIAAHGFYPRVYMLLTVPKAGTYCFGFKIEDNGIPNSYFAITMDDFRADYVVKPSSANVVRIPNGDFEQVYTNDAPNVLSAKSSSGLNKDNHAVGWTLHQGDNTVATTPSVAIASAAVPYQLSQINGTKVNENSTGSRFSRIVDDTYGTFSLFMAYIFKSGKVDRGGNNYATTTFTVEKAGTYYLRGKVSRWNISYDGADFLGGGNEIPSIKATMTVGGADNELGALVGDRHLQQDRYWTTPFTVAEDNAEVTLKIEQTVKGAAAIVDDLVLVKAVDGVADDPAERGKEYITNGSFEDGITGKESYTAKSWGTAGGQGSSASISFWINIGNGLQYTTGAYDGIGACSVRSDSTLYQTLPAMKAGKYRFRVAANSRNNPKYGHNGFKAWLEKSGSDPVDICRIGNVHNGNPKVHYFDFEVPEDGVYTFKLQGTVAGQPDWALGTIVCVVDGLSIKRVFDEDMVLPEVPANTKITVASGAKLKLDFDGSLDVGTVTLGGTKVYGGEVSAASHPDFIEGTGKLGVTTSNKGMLLLIR